MANISTFHISTKGSESQLTELKALLTPAMEPMPHSSRGEYILYLVHLPSPERLAADAIERGVPNETGREQQQEG